MRSRYTAYVLKNVDYLVKTTLPASREPDLANDIRNWMNQVQWQKLHVLSTEAGGRSDNEGIVEFIAEFIGPHGADRHHERSRFKKFHSAWYYVTKGESPPSLPCLRRIALFSMNERLPCRD